MRLLFFLLPAVAFAQPIVVGGSSSGGISQDSITTNFVDAGTIFVTTENAGTFNSSFIDAGAIRVGGKAVDFWLVDDFCLGTSTANTCSGGAELTWSPNSVYLGNVTSGEGMQISGTSVAINKGGGVFGGTQRKLVVAQNTNPQLIQHGHGAMTAGALAVTFTDTYGAAPDCACTHTSTTNLNGCAIDTANPATTAGVTFTVTLGGTDRVDWTCVGDR